MNTIFKLKNFLFSFFRVIDRSFQEELDIALPQFMVLVAINNNPMGTQAVLAEFRKITPAGISKQINILLKKKLIERKNNKSDKREHSIILTLKGKKIFESGIKIFQKHQEKVFKNIPKESVKKMNDTLDNLLLSIDTSFMTDCKYKM